MPAFTIKQEAYAAIEVQFACMHSDRELRLRVTAGGRPAFYRQCTRCGNAGKAISKRDAAEELHGADAQVFDTELELRWFAQKHATYVATYHAIKPEVEKEYQTYLSSPTWFAKRDAVIQKAKAVCECCQYFTATQVHHLTYARIGKETSEDLMAVCGYCHGVVHRKYAL